MDGTYDDFHFWVAGSHCADEGCEGFDYVCYCFILLHDVVGA